MKLKTIINKLRAYTGKPIIRVSSERIPCAYGSVNIWTGKVLGKWVSIQKVFDGYTPWGLAYLKNIFGKDCTISGQRVVPSNISTTFFINDIMWIWNGDEWRTVASESYLQKLSSCILFNITTNKYYGFSHRSVCGFGYGDILFDPDEEDTLLYCKNPKWRRRFIKRLIHYHRSGDWDGFHDLSEYGITSIIPFRYRGKKAIKTAEDAMVAASNFADYVG